MPDFTHSPLQHQKWFSVADRILILLIIIICGTVILLMYEHFLKTSEAQTTSIKSHEENEFLEMKLKLEGLFMTMYQNGRIISLLPEMREIQGGNLGRTDKTALESGRLKQTTHKVIQQIYNNIASNVPVSEIYAVLDGFDPYAGETPFFMYDELILKDRPLFTGKSHQTQTGSDVPAELEDEEYEWFARNIPLIKARYPTFNFERLQDIPFVISEKMRTCDNTQYLSIKHGDVSNSEGFIMAIPLYSETGLFRGVIAVIFRANMLEAALLKRPFIPVTEEDVALAKQQDWSLPPSPGRFVLVDKVSNVKVFDRRNPVLATIDDNPGYSANRLEQRLDLPFANNWSLIYLNDIERLTALTDREFQKFTLTSIFTLVLSLLIIGIVYFYRRNQVQKQIEIINEKKLVAAREIMLLNERLEQQAIALKIERDRSDQASEAKSRFLSNMSHEIRTPMNAVLGFCQLLQLEEDLPDAARSCVDEIMTAGNHLLELINEILDLSAIDSGKIRLSYEEASLSLVTQDAIHIISRDADMRGISLQVSVNGSPVKIEQLESIDLKFRTDPTRLKQIMLNLLSNAVKYNKDNGTIIISLLQDQLRTRVEVTDQGCGMGDEAIQQLFRPFERLGMEDKAIQGTGIGLVISKNLVEYMGGEIGVISRINNGTTFWFELPRANSNETE